MDLGIILLGIDTIVLIVLIYLYYKKIKKEIELFLKFLEEKFKGEE